MKFSELPTKTDRGRDVEVENAVVKSIGFSTEDHGVLTSFLHLEFGSGGCGFGGYVLGKLNEKTVNTATGNYAALWIIRCIETVFDKGYGKWEDIEGQPIRIVHEGLGGGIIAIGHFLKDSWFCPRIEFEKK